MNHLKPDHVLHRQGLNRKGDCCDSVEIYADNGILEVSQQVDKVLSEVSEMVV